MYESGESKLKITKIGPNMIGLLWKLREREIFVIFVADALGFFQEGPTK